MQFRRVRILIPRTWTYTKKYAEILHRLYVDDQSAPGLGETQSGKFFDV